MCSPDVYCHSWMIGWCSRDSWECTGESGLRSASDRRTSHHCR